jgi:hypothetical protein
MRYLMAALSVMAIATTSSAQGGGARLAACLHGQNETSEHAARREKAIKVAHAINAAEVVTVGPQSSRPKYRRPGDLNLPPLPQGFALQFNTDGVTYNFSIKDTLDACHFAVFSDQDKLVYTATPLSGARIVPLTTRR